MELKFGVKGQQLRMLAPPTVVAESIGYLTARFSFDQDWDRLDIWAHMKSPEGVVADLQLDAEGKLTGVDLTEGRWEIWLHGNDVTADVPALRLTTNTVVLQVRGSNVCVGGVFPNVPVSALEQVSSNAANAVREVTRLRSDMDTLVETAGTVVDSARSAQLAAAQAGVHSELAGQSAQSSQLSAQSAANSADSSRNAASSASAAAQNAKASQTAAADSAEDANAALLMADSMVRKAGTAASAAETSAQNAKTSQSAAVESEQAAVQAARSAEHYADIIQSLVREDFEFVYVGAEKPAGPRIWFDTSAALTPLLLTEDPAVSEVAAEVDGVLYGAGNVSVNQHDAPATYDLTVL